MLTNKDPDYHCTILPGVFMNIYNHGVLIQGESGIGKSELALNLIDRCHQLISDDAVEFHKNATQIIGRAPITLKKFIEIKGLGILNIEKIYGSQAICYEQNLNIIINLVKATDHVFTSLDRLKGNHNHKKILGEKIYQIDVPVFNTRNLSVITECIVKNHVDQLNGYYSYENFLDLQQQKTEKKSINKYQH